MTRPLAGALLVALWLGAALLTVTVVAPGAFAVLPTRAMAGDMVGRVLPVVFAGAIVVPALVFWLVPSVRRSVPALSAGALSMLSSVVALAVVNPRIAAVRFVAVVPIDQLSPGDPRRALFGLLHFISVALLGAAILALGALLVTLARATVSRVQSSGVAR
ncbi:MAG: DUF4149 domain-containing protein [Gemmatimonadota bacterium]